MYEQENREPDIAILIRIAEFFNVTIDYLLGTSAERGRYGDNILVSSDNEKALVEAYRSLDEIERSEVRGYLLGYAARAKNIEK